MRILKMSIIGIITVVIVFVSVRLLSARQQTCDYCYYQNQKYSNGAVSGLNSICSFKCSNGQWQCQGCAAGKPCHNQSLSKTCKPCMFQNMAYSEGAPCSLNSIYYYICHDGNWVKQP
ncbi:DUF1496 domain-containing protein [Chitinophaga sp. Hz27]|uniref:DUF1496 domain-containing protein n=1 Tax=Chitinophaga sp. Hz27 TaxID=3347169 RepID=UPI0035DAE01B